MTNKRPVTIKDIAQHAHVAVSTVSRVLNNLDRVSPETREKVLLAVNELGYVQNNLAASIVTGRTKVILIVVPDFINSFYGAVVQGAEQYLRSHNYLTMVTSTGDRENTNIAAVTQKMSYAVDGAIIIPSVTAAKDLETFNKPIILVDRSIPGSHCSTVTVDNFGGAYQITRELLDAGHRKIGIIIGNTRLNIGRDRLNGYLQALSDCGVSLEERYIQKGNFYEEDGYRFMHALLELEDAPTAVVAGNNLICIGCINAIQNAGLAIGRDISLVGFDDHNLAAAVKPGITVADRPTVAMGEKAAELLLEHLQSAEAPQKKDIVMEVRLIRRGSVQPPHTYPCFSP